MPKTPWVLEPLARQFYVIIRILTRCTNEKVGLGWVYHTEVWYTLGASSLKTLTLF